MHQNLKNWFYAPTQIISWVYSTWNENYFSYAKWQAEQLLRLVGNSIIMVYHWTFECEEEEKYSDNLDSPKNKVLFPVSAMTEKIFKTKAKNENIRGWETDKRRIETSGYIFITVMSWKLKLTNIYGEQSPKQMFISIVFFAYILWSLSLCWSEVQFAV